MDLALSWQRQHALGSVSNNDSVVKTPEGWRKGSPRGQGQGQGQGGGDGYWWVVAMGSTDLIHAVQQKSDIDTADAQL